MLCCVMRTGGTGKSCREIRTAVEVGVAAREGCHARRGAGDEVVIDDVCVALPVAVAGDVTAAATPVVNHLMQPVRRKRALEYEFAAGLTLFWKSFTPLTLGLRVLLSMYKFRNTTALRVSHCYFHQGLSKSLQKEDSSFPEVSNAIESISPRITYD